MGSDLPMTADSATAGCEIKLSSNSTVPNLWPATFRTSSALPSSQK